MGPPAAGQVVLLPFPFSDLSRNKLRPAVLVADAGRGDWVACQITSNPYADPRALMLADGDFSRGGLHRVSFVRPLKLVTVSDTIFQAYPGLVRASTLQRIRSAVIAGLNGSAEPQPLT